MTYRKACQADANLKTNKKILATMAASLVALLITGFLTFSWVLSSNIMHPSFVCSEEHFIYCGDPSQLDLSFEDISF